VTAFPQQAAAIPFRRRDDGLEVCLIRRRHSRTWGIPKGQVEEGDTHEETAVSEAFEEAGLVGRVVGGSIGAYQYEKWGRTLTVAVYLLEVLDERDAWEEDAFRQRRWHPVADGMAMLEEHPVAPLLGRARVRLGQGSSR
jgi:8-oxo-dGTP pyrophosphatase MutT (NUDIX family)